MAAEQSFFFILLAEIMLRGGNVTQTEMVGFKMLK